MRRTPTRTTNTRLGVGLTPPPESKSWVSSKGNSTGRRSGHRANRNDYTDLDRDPLTIENYLSQKQRPAESPKRRARRKPEVFLTDDKSCFALRALPEVKPPETVAAEESILKKWEAWSSQMGAQLALESAVSTAPVARAVSRNSSFRSVSQLSNNSATRPRPGSARGASPLSQSGRRSVSHCSSRSRQSSLASTVVEPFRVGDRMTASAERKRRAPQSTKGSRELLFRRALGLDDDKDDVRNTPAGSTSMRIAPSPGPLIAPPQTISPGKQPVESRQSQREQISNRKEDPTDPQLQLKETSQPSNLSQPKAKAEVRTENLGPSTESSAAVFGAVKTGVAEKTVLHDDIWLKKSAAFLNAKNHPHTDTSQEDALSKSEKPHEASHERKGSGLELAKEKWHLPLGEAAQMTCGRVVIHTVGNCRSPQISYRDVGSERTVDVLDIAPSIGDDFTGRVEWPIDRASVTVLFVDHHIDDDQLSAYGVEVPSREECSPDVLPDWNESRRRFAPAPLEDSQQPQ